MNLGMRRLCRISFFLATVMMLLHPVIADDNVTIISIEASYSNGYNVSGLSETISLRMNMTGINDTTNTSVILNASAIGCDEDLPFIYNISSFVWEASCLISSYLPLNTYSLVATAENIFGSTDTMSVTVYVDTLAPVVTLLTPLDRSYSMNITPSSRFNFSVSDFSMLQACVLYLDGEMKSIKEISAPGTYYFDNITIDAVEKDYLWNITCNDTLGNSNNMTAWTLNIDYTSPDVHDLAAINGSVIHRQENITIRLTENTIDESTISTSTVTLKDQSNNAVRFRLTLENDTLVIDPYLYLYDNHTYILRMGAIKDLAGNTMAQDSDIIINTFPHSLDVSGSIVGNISHINTNLDNDDLNITLEGEPISYAASYSSTRRINFSDGNVPVFSIVFNFAGSNKLQLNNLMIMVNEISGIGSTIIYGVSGTKNIFVEKIDPGLTGVCIKSDALHVGDFSVDCSASGEAWYNCTANSTKCRDLGNGYLKVTGITGTGVVQMNYTIAPEITSITRTLSGDVLTFRVYTEDDATCRARMTVNSTYSGMPSVSETALGTTHVFTNDNLGAAGSKTYYVSCRDSYGNVAYDSFQFTVTSSSSSSTTTSTTSTTGATTPPAVATKIIARKYTSWNYLDAGQRTTIRIDNEKIPVTRIEFTVGVDNTESPSLEVKVLEKSPTGITAPHGTAYSYLDFSTLRLYTVRTPKISFRVENEWLDQGNDPSGVLLMRYYNRNWTILETNMLTVDDLYTYYEAESPGFSYFAIVGTKPAPIKPKATPRTSSSTKTIEASDIPESDQVELMIDTGDAILTEDKVVDTMIIEPRFGISYLKPSTKTANGIALMLLIVAVGLGVYRHFYAKSHHPSYRVIKRKR